MHRLIRKCLEVGTLLGTILLINFGCAEPIRAHKPSDFVQEEPDSQKNSSMVDLSREWHCQEANIRKLDATRFESTHTIRTERFRFVLTSLCIDDTFIEYGQELFPVVNSQQLSLFLDDSLLMTVKSRAKLKPVQLIRGKHAESLESIVLEIGLLQGKFGKLFFAEGAGGCNSCLENRMIYSEQGELLFEYYGSVSEVLFSKGDPQKIYSQYGVTDTSVACSVETNLLKFTGSSNQF